MGHQQTLHATNMGYKVIECWHVVSPESGVVQTLYHFGMTNMLHNLLQGYNAMTDTVEDLLAAGVIDPAKVTRNGLQNACSIAGG